MKLSRISFLFLLLFLLVPSVSYAQSAADKAWKPFWTKFSRAMKNKNRAVLKSLMAKDFDSNCITGEPRNCWLKLMDDENLWGNHQEVVASGTISCGKNCRVTVDKYLIFNYKNGRWLWTTLWGD